jgi:hypothetical protein
MWRGLTNLRGTHPRFGMIHAPKTRAEKIKHQAVLGTIPLELVPAVDEWNEFGIGSMAKSGDPISRMLLRHESSPEMELVQSMCKACAQKEHDSGIWEVFVSRANEVLPSLSAFDSAILLKCFVLFEQTSGETIDSDLIAALIKRLAKGETISQVQGHHALLYGLQALNHYTRVVNAKTNAKYFHIFLRNIRYSSAPFSVLLASLQAVSVRVPTPAGVLVGPLFTEISDRIEANRITFDTDMLFGLLSSVARIKPTSESTRLLELCKKQLLDPDEAFLASMSIEQLVGVAHAYSRLGPAVNAKNIDIFKLVGNELRQCHNWTPRTLSVAINAYGTACVAHSDLVEAWKGIPGKLFTEMDSQQIAMSVYGLSKLGLLNIFPILLRKAEELIADLDLHSTSKLIAAIEPTGYDISKYLAHFMRRVGSGNLKSADVDSVSLVLNSLKAIGAQDNAGEIDILFLAIASSITVSSMSNLSLLLSHFIAYRSEAFEKLNTACLERMLNDEETSKLTLTEIIRFMHVFGLTIKIEPEQSQLLRKCIISKHSELPKLGYRTLTRLASAMVRCGVYDEDLSSAIEENLKKFKPRQ